MRKKLTFYGPAFIGLCFLLQSLSLPVTAQGDSTRSAPSRALQTYGFGPELVISSPASFHVERGASPDLYQAQRAAFDLPYDSFQQRLSHDPHSNIFWIRVGIRNTSDSELPIDI